MFFRATTTLALFVVPAVSSGMQQEPLLPQDTAVRVGTLDNGLTYYVRANGKPAKIAELRLVVKAGSNQEDDDQRGIAHFVEHMAFNGTERFPKHALIEYLESIGVKFGADINAATTFDNTTYDLRIPTANPAHLATGLDVLAEWAGKLTFDSLEVVAERGVILEEWRRALSSASKVRDQQMAVTYAGSKYADRLPIGLPSIIETTNPSLLKRFYHDWYRPNLMAVVVVGDIDPDAMVAMIRERFSSLVNPANARPREQYAIPEHEAPIVSIITDTVIPSPSISVQYRFRQEKVDDREQMRNTMIWNFMSSAVNQRLREQAQVPNPPFLGGQIGISGLGELNYVFSVSVSPRPDAMSNGFRAVLAEIERVARYGITDEEFARIKMVTLKNAERGLAERANVQSGSYAQQYASAYLSDLAVSDPAAEHALLQEILPSITNDDIKKAAEVWREPRNRVISVMLPKRNDILTPDTAVFLSAFNRVQSMSLAAYVEPPAPTRLLETLPAPGAIVSTIERDQGVTEWILSNGIRVLLRPSTNTNDQVVIQGESPGGYYLNVEQYGIVPASTASQLVGMSGIGDFSPTDLGKMLAGRSVQAGASVEPFSEHVGGAAVWSDIETAFQLMYLAVTKPRIDTVMFRAYLERARAQLENTGYNPEQAFQDTVRFAMAQYHPWVTMPPATALDSLDLQKSFAVFKNRFADMSDFRFVIVGDFELDSIAPFVTQYLGALPGGGRKEAFKDPGIRPPSTVVKKVVTGGTEPKTTTILTFTGEVPIERGTRWAISGLGLVLQQRLHAKLREELSGTYSVQAEGNSARIPVSSYSIRISYVSAPERADELLAATFAVIEELRNKPALDVDVASIKEVQLKAMANAVDSDQFWLSRIAMHDDLGLPLSEITNDTLLREWSPADVQRAAQQFLHTDRYTLFQLVPAGE